MPEITLKIPQASLDRLERMAESIGTDSYGEVFRNALRLYEACIQETEQGGTVVVIRADGAQYPVFSSSDD